MSQPTDPREPKRLDEHRASRGRDPKPAPDADREPAEAAEDGDESPASFEESAAVKRARHIEHLRAIVDAGNYQPDPGQIAESMLENERS